VVTVGDDGGRAAGCAPSATPAAARRPAAGAGRAGRDDRSASARPSCCSTGSPATDPLAGHAVGNLLLLGLMELLGDPVAALEHAGRMVGARGRVLPMARTPVGIEADVPAATRPPGECHVRGQHAVAVTIGTSRRSADAGRPAGLPQASARSRPPTG
jgi:hypothetical protein